MQTTFHSFKELLSGCSNTELKQHVSSVLTDDKYIRWELMTCTLEGDVCRSEFSSQIENSDCAYHLSYELNPNGQYGYISIVDSMMV